MPSHLQTGNAEKIWQMNNKVQYIIEQVDCFHKF